MTGTRRPAPWLLLILLLALGLRLWGCFGQGYPYSFYDDEKANVQRALNFGARGSLDPDWFNKPALGYYALFAQYGLYYLVGDFESPDEFALSYVSNQGPFYLIGRIGTTLFGVLTILLTYHLGRLLADRRTGLLAALVLTFTLGHAASCQEVKMDVPATCFTVWAAIFLVRILEKGRWRDYLWAGFFTGLGVATKYIPAVLVFPLLYAHVFRAPEARERSPRAFTSPRLYGAILAIFGGFFAGSPYNFLNPRAHDWVLGQLGFAGQRFGFGCLPEAVAATPRGPLEDGTFWDALSAVFACLGSTAGLGALLCVLACLGVAVALRRRDRLDGLLVTSALVIIVLGAAFNRLYAEPRHLNPLYPFAAVLAAQGFVWAWNLVAPKGVREGVWSLGVLALLLAVPLPGWPARSLVEHDLRQLEADPRVTFKNWFEANVPGGATVINDFGRVPLVPNGDRCQWMLGRIDFLEQIENLTAGRAATYRKYWRVRLEAASRHQGPTYDTIVLVHDWQVERLPERLQARGAYNPLWPPSPWGWVLRRVLNEARKEGTLPEIDAAAARAGFEAELRPQDRVLAPVELWTRPTRATALFLVGRRQSPRWLVTARGTCENYQSRSKRRSFPDFAAFYDDLQAHYDCLEFNSEDPDPGRILRLYDLSRRVEAGRVERRR